MQRVLVLTLVLLSHLSQGWAQCRGGFNAIGEPLAYCAGTPFTIYYTGDTAAPSYTWVWGDGGSNTVSTTDAVHTYAATGSYTLRFYRNFNGCTDSIVKTITVVTAPVPDFTSTPDSTCHNGIISFTNTSTTPGPTSYLWNFGDPTSGALNTATTTNASHRFANRDTVAYRNYGVTLRATTSQGCVASITKDIVVSPRTIASFGMPNRACSGQPVAFNNNSSPMGATYQWNFGDPASGADNTSTASDPEHIYNPPAAGVTTYTVTLVVTGPGGCTDTARRNVQIQFNNLNAQFVVGNDSACSGQTVTFTNQSTPAAGLTYQWDYGDTSISVNTATTANGSHIYNYAFGGNYSTYTARLVISTAYGCRDTAYRTVTIQQKPYTEVDDSCNITPFRNCNASSANPAFIVCLKNLSLADTGMVSFYRIAWGDGQILNVQPRQFVYAISHQYNTLGSFPLRVTAYGKNGCNGITSITVVNDTTPVFSALATGPTEGCAPVRLSYALNTFQASGSTRVAWNFNDSTPIVTWTTPQAGDTIQHLFNRTSCTRPGQQYVVTIRVTNGCGTISQDITDTRIFESPVANFVTSGAACSGILTSFNITSPASYGINCDTNRTAFWQFGDPASGTDDTLTSLTPTHAYTRSDSFTVTLVLSNTCGSDTVTRRIAVDTIPVIRFTTSWLTVTNCKVAQLAVEDSSTGGNLKYKWSLNWLSRGGPVVFDSATTDSSRNPVITMPNSGQYSLILTLSNGCGLRVDSVPVTVSEVPEVMLSEPPALCEGELLFPLARVDTFYMPATYQWDFPGAAPPGSASAEPDTITYIAAGTFNIVLRVTNLCGTDSASVSVTVHPKPVANASVDNTDQCFAGNSFVFDDLTAAPLTQVFWDFGDGDTISGAPRSHSYLTPDSFWVTQIVTSNMQCSDTTQLMVYALAAVDARLLVSDTIQCISGNRFFFGDSSLITYDVPGTRVISFGDGGTSGQDTVGYSYTQAGTYTAVLRVTTSKGCTDSASREVIVIPLPVVDIGPDDTSLCPPYTIILDAANTGADFTWSTGDTTQIISVSQPGTYSVAVNNGYCTATDSIDVISLPVPLVNLGADTMICYEDSVMLDAGNAGATYIWNTGDTTQQVQASPGTWWVIASLGICSDNDTVVVGNWPIPPVNIAYLNTACFESTAKVDSAVIQASGSGYSYLWSPGGQTTQQIAVYQPGTYYVMVTDLRGCINTDSLEVESYCAPRVFIPNAFSPNNDGINDRFLIVNSGVRSFQIVIYNRWGEKVFETTDITNSWDGQYRGVPALEGVYYYILKYEGVGEGAIKTIVNKNGTITLLR